MLPRGAVESAEAEGGGVWGSCRGNMRQSEVPAKETSPLRFKAAP